MTYCDERLTDTLGGCQVKEAAAPECEVDLDCAMDQTQVCRSQKCHKTPVCHVKVCDEWLPAQAQPSCFTLPPVLATRNPGGVSRPLKASLWSYRLKSIELGSGCAKVVLSVDGSAWADKSEYTVENAAGENKLFNYMGGSDKSLYTEGVHSPPKRMLEVTDVRIYAAEVPRAARRRLQVLPAGERDGAGAPAGA